MCGCVGVGVLFDSAASLFFLGDSFGSSTFGHGIGTRERGRAKERDPAHVRLEKRRLFGETPGGFLQILCLGARQ